MSLDALVAVITAEAKHRAAALLADAEARAEAVYAEAAQGADRRRTERMAALERDHGARNREEAAAAEQAARSQALAARERAIARVVDAVDRRLATGDLSPAWQARLPDLVDAALVYIGDAPARVVCRPEVAATVAAVLGDRAELQSTDGASPGLRVDAVDGSVSVEATLPALLHALRPRLRREALALLGEPP